MPTKIAVQFRKTPKNIHTFERLRYCKSCGHYSVLWDDSCEQCGKQNFIPATKHIEALNRKKFHTELLGIVTFFCLTILVARSLLEIIIAIVAGIGLIGFYIYLRYKYKTTINHIWFHKTFKQEVPGIRKGLQLDMELAIKQIDEEQYKVAYEMLREIGYFLLDEPIKHHKLWCLYHFIIRKDMDLELDALIPSSYDPGFVLYLYEVSKVNKGLIKSNALDYVITYRSQIRNLDRNHDMMTSIAGAALRAKQYVDKYQALLIEHVEYFPKERLLRLCQLLSKSDPRQWPELYSKTKEIVHAKYSYDPEFSGLL